MSHEARTEKLRLQPAWWADRLRNQWKPAWHLKYDQLFFETPIQFYHEQFGTVTTSGEGRWLVRAWTGFRIPVRRNLQFGLEHRLEYDSEPVENVDELESTLSIKVGYVW